MVASYAPPVLLQRTRALARGNFPAVALPCGSLFSPKTRLLLLLHNTQAYAGEWITCPSRRVARPFFPSRRTARPILKRYPLGLPLALFLPSFQREGIPNTGLYSLLQLLAFLFFALRGGLKVSTDYYYIQFFCRVVLCFIQDDDDGDVQSD